MQTRSTIALAGAVTLAAAAVTTVWLTPRPVVALIRRLFDAGARATLAEMERHPPRGPVTERLGIRYGLSREDTRYDLYRPAEVDGALPVIVWIHGGAWISGTRADVGPYLRILAAEGFATVSVDYTIAPGATYPTPVRQVNAALAHLVSNADSLGIDPERIVLAGDSAGAQLASQVAALTTNPELAALLGIEPALRPTQLRAAVLACGVYDLSGVSRLRGIVGWGFAAALWAYLGRRRWSETPEALTMSTIDFVTEAFPASFITGGNGDALTRIQSVPFATRLQDLGVPVTAPFRPDTTVPALPHEYQFHLDLPEARATLAETVAFLRAQLGE